MQGHHILGQLPVFFLICNNSYCTKMGSTMTTVLQKVQSLLHTNRNYQAQAFLSESTAIKPQDILVLKQWHFKKGDLGTIQICKKKLIIQHIGFDIITYFKDRAKSVPTYDKLVNHFPPGCVNLLSRQLWVNNIFSQGMLEHNYLEVCICWFRLYVCRLITQTNYRVSHFSNIMRPGAGGVLELSF